MLKDETRTAATKLEIGRQVLPSWDGSLKFDHARNADKIINPCQICILKLLLILLNSKIISQREVTCIFCVDSEKSFFSCMFFLTILLSGVAFSILINVAKCPAKSKRKSPFFTLAVVFMLVSFLGLDLRLWFLHP